MVRHNQEHGDPTMTEYATVKLKLPALDARVAQLKAEAYILPESATVSNLVAVRRDGKSFDLYRDGKLTPETFEGTQEQIIAFLAGRAAHAELDNTTYRRMVAAALARCVSEDAITSASDNYVTRSFP